MQKAQLGELVYFSCLPQHAFIFWTITGLIACCLVNRVFVKFLLILSPFLMVHRSLESPTFSPKVGGRFSPSFPPYLDKGCSGNALADRNVWNRVILFGRGHSTLNENAIWSLLGLYSMDYFHPPSTLKKDPSFSSFSSFQYPLCRHCWFHRVVLSVFGSRIGQTSQRALWKIWSTGKREYFLNMKMLLFLKCHQYWQVWIDSLSQMP